MAETFEECLRRLTRAGVFDFSKLLAFIDSVPDFAGGFYKCAGVEKGPGLIPRSSRNPESGLKFVFPLLAFDRTKDPIEVSPVEPRCPRCGKGMRRRKRISAEFFACVDDACKGACDAWDDIAWNPSVAAPPSDPAPVGDVGGRAKAFAFRIVAIVVRAREAADKHGMSLPIGHRTTDHLCRLAVLVGDPDDAWRLWVDGRVSKQEREKLDAAGLPSGPPPVREPVAGEPSWYGTIASVLDDGMPVLVVGPAGSGKTKFAEWYAATRAKSLERAVGSGDVAGRELWVARRDVVAGEVLTVPGPAARAATNGDVLFLDEVDAYDPNSLIPLNSILNGDDAVSVPVLGEVRVHPDLRIVAAANTNGRSRDRTYAARNRLDGAFLNRFAVVLRVGYERAVDDKIALSVLSRAFGE